MFILVKGKRSLSLKLEPNLERYSAEVLRGILNYRIGLQSTIQDLDEMLTGISQAAALPYVKIKTQRTGEGKSVKYAYIDGTAVLNKDKMIGTITEAETRGVLWLRDEIKGYTVSVEIEGEEGVVSLNPVSARVELVPQIKDEKWKMHVDVATEGAIVQNETNIAFEDQKLLKEVEEAYQKSIEKRIRDVLQVMQQKLNADLADF